MFNEEVSKRKERKGIILIIAFFVVLVLFGLFETINNPPEKRFKECVEIRMTQELDNLPIGKGEHYIKMWCCVDENGIPIIDIDGEYSGCIYKDNLIG